MTIPPVTCVEAAELAKSLYGKIGRVKLLGSCQDANFKLTCEDGVSYVIKVTNSDCSREDIDYQCRTIAYLSRPDSPCRHLDFPRVLPMLDGVTTVGTVVLEGMPYFIRLLTYVEGEMMSDFKYYSSDSLFNLGVTMGQIVVSLTDFPVDNPEWGNNGYWDMRRATETITPLLAKIEDLSLRYLLSRVAELASAKIKPLSPHFNSQIVHGDLALYNLVGGRTPNGRPRITGVIDFGDVMRSWVVSELAVALVSSFEHQLFGDSPLLHAIETVKGFHSVCPLNEHEVMAVWPLVLLRSVVNIVLVHNELLSDPTSEYNRDGLQKEWLMGRAIISVDVMLAQEAFRLALGLPASPNVASITAAIDTFVFQPLFDFNYTTLRVLDLSPVSEVLQQGQWLDSRTLREVVASAIAEQSSRDSTVVSYLAYGEPLLHLTTPRSLTAPKTVPLGITLFLPAGTNILAPCDCQVRGSVDLTALVLVTDKFDIVIRNVILPEPIATLRTTVIDVKAGDVCGQVSAAAEGSALPTHVFVQTTCRHWTDTIEENKFSRLPDHEILPSYCNAALFPYYSILWPEPHSLLGRHKAESALPATRPTFVALESRRAHVAAVQEHYFKQPPSIERAFHQYMYDSSGRAYLDVVNNVALVGHCNPRVTAAMTRQASLLNTNSRFVYRLLGSFAEKIISKFPVDSGMEVVLFVNSGSEATDLAMRLARTVVAERRRKAGAGADGSVEQSSIAQRSIICLEGAYHGVTTASDEVSTTLNDNPRSRESRPPWIHLVPMPNAYRGLHPFDSSDPVAAEEAGQQYSQYVTSKVSELAAKGCPPAAFIAEPLSGNAGGVELPPGYLQQVYRDIRAVGGLCIADEVQVGYGRLGNVFWGHQEHGVLPDIVTMAKAAGNGHPLGFVVTSRAIADEFGADGSFFSSAGGGPVSCAVGLAVLEEIEAACLQDNASKVGSYLREQLLGLKTEFPSVVGAVHGHGLYMGIEIIADLTTRAPGTAIAYALCERLLELGVICHNTGDYSNVLKVKPPLVLTMEDADFFVTALRLAFTGW